MFEPADRTGEILQQVDINVKADDEGLVLGAQSALEERASDRLFHVEDALLAAAGVDENAEGQREIGFGLEVFDGLGLAVLEQGEVVFGGGGGQGAMFVFDVEEQLDDLDVDLEGLGGLVLRLGVGVRRRSREILSGCGQRQGYS